MPAFPGLAQSLGLLSLGLATMLGSLALFEFLPLPGTARVLLSTIVGSVSALAIGVRFGQRPFARAVRIGPAPRPGWVVLAPMLLGVMVIAVELVNLSLTLWPPPEAFLQFMEELMEPRHPAERLLTLALAGGLGPLVEEFLFRGLILQGLIGRYGARAGILLSSILFALYHFNPWQGAAALTLGLLLGWVTHRAGHIGYAVALHCGNNLLILLVAGAVPALSPEAARLDALEHVPVVLLVAAGCALAWGIVRFAREFPCPAAGGQDVTP
ncbi:MAG: type II CAAX endopeptidase family protein [Acidobacteriota bacterium]